MMVRYPSDFKKSLNCDWDNSNLYIYAKYKWHFENTCNKPWLIFSLPLECKISKFNPLNFEALIYLVYRH